MQYVERIAYTLHMSFIGLTMMGWVYVPILSLLMPVTVISWELNNNRCLISDLEKYCFQQELISGDIHRTTRLLLLVDMTLSMYAQLACR